MYFVEVAPDSGDGLHAVFEVHEGLVDELVREIVGAGEGVVGAVDVLQAGCMGVYMAAWLAIIYVYSCSSISSCSIYYYYRSIDCNINQYIPYHITVFFWCCIILVGKLYLNHF